MRRACKEQLKRQIDGVTKKEAGKRSKTTKGGGRRHEREKERGRNERERKRVESLSLTLRRKKQRSSLCLFLFFSRARERHAFFLPRSRSLSRSRAQAQRCPLTPPANEATQRKRNGRNFFPFFQSNRVSLSFLFFSLVAAARPFLFLER